METKLNLCISIYPKKFIINISGKQRLSLISITKVRPVVKKESQK